MDTSYYFVLDADGVDDGPYRLPEIHKRIDVGLISRGASLCRVGETAYVPLGDPRFAELLQPLPRAASGTQPPPVVEAKPEVIHVAQPIAIPSVVKAAKPADQPMPPVSPRGPVRATPPQQPVQPAQPPMSQAPAPKVEPMQPPAVATMPPGFVPPVTSRADAPTAFVPPVAPHAPVAVQPPGYVPPPPGYVPPPPGFGPVAQVYPHEAPPVRQELVVVSAPQLPPPQLQLPAPPMQMQAPAPRKRTRAWLFAAVAVGVVGAGIAIAATRGGSVTAKDAIVRVTTGTGTGAGFFIEGPDKYAYVATANHVVDRGERVLVERDVGNDKDAFVEAYPETEIVATDADADLAILRIKNVEASRFSKLPLAQKPTKDARILSYGYPGSSLATHAGLVSKDGKVLSLVSFPAYDDRYARVLRDNAVDGLLVSSEIEPGMSGGPTLNDSGEVVGVNVTKDRAHVGQNGAVSVTALRTLLGKVQPADAKVELKPDDVASLLDKIQSEYLLLPLEERSKVRETEFVHAGDLPSLRQLVGEVRREERNTDTTFIAKYQLSGQAALGMFFARMPGKLLETYRAPATTTPLVACELANQRLTSFLGDLSPSADAPRASLDTCDELAVRPLAWDLVAATLQWDGHEKKYTVTKLDKMDDEGRVYRASLRISGASNLVELWLGVDQGHVRLKVFDAGGNLYAIKSPRTVSPNSFQGTWSVHRPRVTDTVNKDAEVESSETVSISVSDGNKVAIRHVVSEKYFGAGNKGQIFRCSQRKTIETGLLQSFTGTLDNGVILAFPDKDSEAMGADASYCKPSHKADRIVAVKLEGDQVMFYRTDGNAYPEAVQLTKDVAPPPAASPTPAQ
ncbi:MAG: trypsin-like peptidase domain-containing protein [Deltaproteobacteria bacterium]|nr:trypsin-like peptidase domain-containing protein [Deltaproteobacteria bacterium]